MNNPEDVQTIAEIQRDEVAKQIKITKCSTKAKDFVTITCANATDAVTLDTELTRKYGSKITVSKTSSQLPKFKICNPPDDVDSSIIIDEIRASNYWLAEAGLSLNRVYKVVAGKRSYCNAIISCNVSILKIVISHGCIIFGLREHYCYEHVDVLQCSKCWSFGHTSSSCRGQIRCKRCSSDHGTATCTATSLKCINCAAHNRRDTVIKYDTKHIASSDLCRCKQDRVSGIKEYLFNQKN